MASTPIVEQTHFWHIGSECIHRSAIYEKVTNSTPRKALRLAHVKSRKPSRPLFPVCSDRYFGHGFTPPTAPRLNHGHHTQVLTAGENFTAITVVGGETVPSAHNVSASKLGHSEAGTTKLAVNKPCSETRRLLEGVGQIRGHPLRKTDDSSVLLPTCTPHRLFQS